MIREYKQKKRGPDMAPPVDDDHLSEADYQTWMRLYTMNDPYNPEHYTDEPIESVEVIELFFRKDSHLATAYAYLHRAGKKAGNPIEQDYQKAIWWLERALQNPLTTLIKQDEDEGHSEYSKKTPIIDDIIRTVFKDRPLIAEAFFRMALALAFHTDYNNHVIQAIKWINQELQALKLE